MAVESVQFAIFLAQGAATRPAHAAAKDIYPDRFPNSFNEVGPDQSVAAFVDPEHQLVIGSAPGRYDLIVTRAVANARPGSLPLDLAKVRTTFLDISGRFAEKVRGSRLAVVVKANTAARSSSDAVSSLRRILPELVIPAGADEVDFKFNVPTQSVEIPNLKVNRLHRWYTGAMVEMMIGPAGAMPGKTQWLCSEEIDVNTDQASIVDSTKSQPLLSELFDEATRHVGMGTDAFGSSNNAG